MKSLPKFKHKLKSMNIDVPPKFLQFYYDNQAITQIFRPVHFEKQKYYNPILSYKPFERVYMDTMYLIYPKQTLAIVNLYDMFSKYGDGLELYQLAQELRIFQAKRPETHSLKC